MLPSKASIAPRILLLFTDIRSPGFSKLFRNKSNIINVTCDEGVTDSDTEDTVVSFEYNCSCGDICVNTTGWWCDGGAFYPSDGPIQDAIDNASAGDTICVKDGTYHENVDVTTANIVIKSEHGAASTTVQALTRDPVFAVSADYVTISGFTVNGTERRIVLGGVADGTISDNTVISTDLFGIGLQDSTCNTITNNSVSDNAWGIRLLSSNSNTITNNIASNTGAGIGLLFSCSNTFIGNTVNSNNEYGFVLELDSNSNSLIGNTANSNNGAGILVRYSSNNTLRDNTANSNNDAGIWLYRLSNDNTLTGNTASNNSNGIVLEGSSNNTLSDNTANSNNEYGILLYSTYWYYQYLSSSNTLTNNTVSNNYHGILLQSSISNTLTSNTADSNSECGIRLQAGGGNTITNNRASNNSDGIFLDITADNTLTGNIVSNNDCGIYLSSSSINLIYNNYFNNTNNAWDDGNDIWNIGDNIWNITPTLGGNIIGGSWQGGNYWSDYDGIDGNGDGLGDTLLPYNSHGNIITGGDKHPLVPAGIAPILAIEKSGKPDHVLPDDTINYSIIVNNNGYAAATGVTVTETYDVNVTFVSADPAPSEGNVTWIFPTLDVNETKWINVSVSVNPTIPRGTYLHNIVNITCNEGITDSDTEDTIVSLVYNCTCGDICVNTTGWWRDGGAFYPSDRPIQDAIDDAYAGDTICVKDGEYNENLDVDKWLTIRSDNGAASTIVNALYSNDHVFEVTTDYVNISGFTVTGATGNSKAGIYENNVDQCNISDNNVSDNYNGIYLRRSSNHTISRNIALNNEYGIRLYYSSNNTIVGNIANSNTVYGIFLGDYNNHIYNNYFNNTNNAYDAGNNIWNITNTSRPNIIGGPYLGGNYWSDYAGTDSNHNGFGDTPYNIPPATNKDYLPLVPVSLSHCFIATAAYGTPLHEDIDVLRDFRDEYLMTNPTGRAFVNIYYTLSPPVADKIRANEGLGTAVREGFVKPLVYVTRGFVG